MRYRTRLFVLLFVFSMLPISALSHDHDPPRILAADVIQKMNAGEEIIFLDSRTDAARSASPLSIANAVPISTVDSVEQVIRETAKGTLVVTFCT